MTARKPMICKMLMCKDLPPKSIMRMLRMAEMPYEIPINRDWTRMPLLSLLCDSYQCELRVLTEAKNLFHEKLYMYNEFETFLSTDEPGSYDWKFVKTALDRKLFDVVRLIAERKNDTFWSNICANAFIFDYCSIQYLVGIIREVGWSTQCSVAYCNRTYIRQSENCCYDIPADCKFYIIWLAGADLTRYRDTLSLYTMRNRRLVDELTCLINNSPTPALQASLDRASFRTVGDRAIEICIALQELELPALMTLTILEQSVGENWPNIAMHFYWNLVVAVKHFHDAPAKQAMKKRRL